MITTTQTSFMSLLENGSHYVGASLSLRLSQCISQQSGVSLLVAPDPLVASRIEEELQFFLDSSPECPVFSFPDWETLAYDRFSPHQDIISQRLKLLYQLPTLKKGVVIISVPTLMTRLCPREYVLQNALWLRVGQTIESRELQEALISAGYVCVSQVMEHGEFASRGSLLDIFPMGSDQPYRIDLFDTEVDTIRTFDPENQKSIDKISEICLLPAREFPLTDEAVSDFRTRFRDQFEGNPTECDVYLDISEKHASPGLEYYLPLFYEQLQTFFDYLPEETNCICIDDIAGASKAFWEETSDRYQRYRHDRSRPLLAPNHLFLNPQELNGKLKEKQVFYFTQISEKEQGICEAAPEFNLHTREANNLEALLGYIETFRGSIVLCAESPGRREIIKELLAKIKLYPCEYNNWSEYCRDPKPLSLLVAPVEKGFVLPNVISLITEAELFGRKVKQKRLRKLKRFDSDPRVQSLADLNAGMPVVHLDYGIGKYLGLITLTHGDQKGEFVHLEYAGGDKLYVPVSSLDKIARYSGVDLEHVSFSKLGTDQWQKAKRKALEQARDTAAELLEIYAKREMKAGIAFGEPDEQYENFCAQFPFEETPDQLQAIEGVIADLVKPKPMDRVVCGDVGFGKTEVALRAAFLSVQNNKQVAVLVPTTLLAEQHYQTFCDRFSNFPVRVEVISRFRSREEQENIIKKTEEGKIDILIGTHKIIYEKIQFDRLGLLIIDEEHRFGVRQKETLKALRTEVNILNLTATPIPRTLNMAMSGLRDLSIIATPPARRLSVKTFVRERNPVIIEEAILRELHRGGQVYFLHNSVESIEREAEFVRSLVPNARVAVAHGQMRERDLEQIMSEFYHRKYNVLVCTTIIETGIDIPTANTMIIDRADKFGLAQLHQLRGRVGRSHHQAYAFCFTPPHAKISSDATKRLEALSQLEELGSGFSLATHDLEIRGAGELLGDSQSGNIQSVGFHLYMELLDQAVAALQRSEDPDKMEVRSGTEVELQIISLIPENYIPDVYTRLILYKRICNCQTTEALDELAVEIIDRFGLLPVSLKNLLAIAKVKLSAGELGIRKIDAHSKGGRFEFYQKPKVCPEKILGLLQQSPESYKLDGPDKFRFQMDLTDPNIRIEKIMELLEMIKS